MKNLASPLAFGLLTYFKLYWSPLKWFIFHSQAGSSLTAWILSLI
jgi:hypothetical protein